MISVAIFRDLSTLRRLAAWGLVFGVFAVAYLLVAAPLLQGHDNLGQALARVDERLRDFKRISNATAGYDAKLDALVAAQSISGMYLDGATEALASAKLQERVVAQVRRAGAAVQRSEPLRSGAGAVGVQVQYLAHTKQIQQIVHSLEEGRPALFVDDIEIVNRRVRNPGRGDETESVLAVRMAVTGFLVPELE